MNKLLVLTLVVAVSICTASAFSEEGTRGRTREERQEWREAREERREERREGAAERREQREERRDEREERRETAVERRAERGERRQERKEERREERREDRKGYRMAPRLLCNIEGDAEIPERRRPTGDCPQDSTCSIGPIAVQFKGREASLTFCDARDEDGHLLIFRGACRIELEDGTTIDRSAARCGGRRSEDCCSRGPLTGFEYNGQPAEAYFPNRMIPRRRRPHFGNDREPLEEVADEIDLQVD
ncbi:hypothetical protein CAPTEDRAFT_223068 [Capitella teleta]|uniref:Uncharacterized protein n=1 Tax=Capitella teleta TaxID=283909 RepID=R7UN73_CAPTE|nr:hypothetical protein CAPTEDRAFT_223068 [Capitella teleta]|eukprot:ELU04841.1 hypothetical protein CAPTEDRAFT_223068 [Capitella teleta]